MTAEGARVGTTVGDKYRIVKFLAAGGMGAVYEAQHIVVRRRFAVKFLHAELSHRRDALKRFTREAEAAGALESEQIAQAVDFGVAGDGTPYIVMEYLNGLDVARLLKALGPLAPERAADIVLQACRGADTAHKSGVIHRDLKPQNLFVCRRGDGTDWVKILDFGVAKLKAYEAASVRTGTGSIVGTPAYMSPEQVLGNTGADPRTDVYALGAILYELLSGRTPHPGDSFAAVVHHIASEPAVPLSAVVTQHLPQGLEEVVHRALSSAPDERQASAEALAAELTPFARRTAWPLVDETPEPSVFGSESTQRSPDTAPLRQAGSLRPSARGRPRLKARHAWLGIASIVAFCVAALWLSRTERKVAPLQSQTRATPSETSRLRPPVAAVPTPPRVSASPANRSPPALASAKTPALTPRVGRPGVRSGRPLGRSPPPSVRTKSPAPAPQVGVKFDSRNPYD